MAEGVTYNVTPEEAEQAHQQAQSTPQEPEAQSFGGGAFKSVEELEAGYMELLAKQNPSDAQPPVETPAEPPVDEGVKLAEETVAEAGLDFKEFSREYESNGSLSQDSYEKLAKAGIPEATVNAFIAGQEALATQIRQDIYASVGGEENHRNLLQWATTTLSPAEIQAFNNAIDSGDVATMKGATVGLYNKYVGTVGHEGQMLQGNRNGSAVVEAYKSEAEVVEAMRDPRYATDRAYRAKVQAKLSRSKLFGVA